MYWNDVFVKGKNQVFTTRNGILKSQPDKKMPMVKYHERYKRFLVSEKTFERKKRELMRIAETNPDAKILNRKLSDIGRQIKESYERLKKDEIALVNERKKLREATEYFDKENIKYNIDRIEDHLRWLQLEMSEYIEEWKRDLETAAWYLTAEKYRYDRRKTNLKSIKQSAFNKPIQVNNKVSNPASALAKKIRQRITSSNLKPFTYYGKNIDLDTARMILKKNGYDYKRLIGRSFDSNDLNERQKEEIQITLNIIQRPSARFGKEDLFKKQFLTKKAPKQETVNRYASIMAEGPARKSNNQIEASNRYASIASEGPARKSVNKIEPSNRYASIASEGPARKSVNKIEPSNRYTSIASEPALKKVVQQVLPSNRYTSIVQEPITKKQAQELQSMLRRIPESDVQARESLIKHQMKKYRLRAGDSLPFRLKRLQTYNKFLYNWLSY